MALNFCMISNGSMDLSNFCIIAEVNGAHNWGWIDFQNKILKRQNEFFVHIFRQVPVSGSTHFLVVHGALPIKSSNQTEIDLDIIPNP